LCKKTVKLCKGLLRVKTKRNVLVVLGWYDPRVIEGIGRFAREAGWHLEMRSILEASPPSGWRGDGLLVNDTAVPRLRGFLRKQVRLQPTVSLGVNHASSSLPSVHEDNSAMGGIAAEHFLRRGFRHFAWVSLPRGRVQRERREGFKQALAGAGYRCHLLEWNPPKGRGSQRWTDCRQWLEREVSGLPKPLAVFALDDLLAIDVVEACLNVGLGVPGDVSVLGVGNLQLACECAQVPISSIDEDAGGIAYAAAAMLERLMDGEKIAVRQKVLPVRGLVLRRSTEVFAARHPSVVRALEWMEMHAAKPLSIGQVAEAAGTSVRALHYAFQEDLRTTPARHLQRIRLERARALLAQGALKIGAVAEECGFGTLRNLHRAHLREYGFSALQGLTVGEG
jgi:LacI family transcriptional regulator